MEPSAANRPPRPVGRRAVVVAALAALAALAGGCLVGPDYRRPGTGTPGDWVGTGLVSTTNPAGQPSVATAGPADVAAWWTSFNDPTLNSPIERAPPANPSH